MTHDTIETTATEAAPIDPIAARLAPILAALTPNAPPEVRRAALDPLRTIYAEICASIDGGPIPRPVMPPTPPPAHPMHSVSIDQILDLAIVQLRPIVGGGAAADAAPLAQLLRGMR